MSRQVEGIILIIVGAAGMLCLILFLGLDTPILMMVLALVILGIGVSMLIDSNKAANNAKAGRHEDDVVSSKMLHKEMNDDRRREGKTSLPAINNLGGASTNNLARKDKSWSSVPDFFVKMSKKKDKQ